MSHLNESTKSICDVLIVEDEHLQAREMAHALSKASLSVELAPDAVTAFEKAKACQPRVALIDCNLPGSNGFLVAKKFEELSPRTAILFMSGHIDGVPESLLETTHGRAFINKPIPLVILRSAILKLLRNIEFGADYVPERRGWMLSGMGSPRGLKIVSSDGTH
ncbi:MAG: response regulator [Proteobacteria bacterium]|nr:response regulator [Pseudomonadota bacterium]